MPNTSHDFDLPSLRALFEPRSVAVIGASAEPTRIGGRVVFGNLDSGFAGKLYPVNPSRGEIQGLKSYPNVASIGVAVDLAVIALPADRVAEALEDCARSKVKSAVVLSSGFAEIGPEGEALQQRLLGIAQGAGMRLMGPNCMGFLNARHSLVASFTRIVNPVSAFKGLSIVSQSGAVGAHFSAACRERGLAYDFWAASGNQADIDFADCLAYAVETPGTRVIIGCIEGASNGGKLIAALELARQRRIPLVLMKIGRSEVGSEAAATHTAALAGSAAVFDEVLRSHGCFSAASVEQAIDVAYACLAGKLPNTDDLGLISTSGGFGVMLADAAAEHGLNVPPLPDDAQAKLKSIVPFAGTRNPVDMTGQYLNDENIIAPMLETLFAAGGYEAVICYIGKPSTLPRLVPHFEGVARRYPDRLLVLLVIGEPEIRRRFEEAGCLVYDDPRRAVTAVAALRAFARAFAAKALPAIELPAAIATPSPGGTLDERRSKRLLAAAGLPMVDDGVARSAADAASRAEHFGFPVVLKVVSPDIPHKSEVGGVRLGITSKEAAARAYDEIVASVRSYRPEARIEGVLVTPQIGDGIEVMLGVKRDPAFGPVVMLALGGIFVETLRDTVIRLAPLTLDGAHQMIGSLKGVAILQGARGKPPADAEALAASLVTLSRFAAANDWLDGVDINPLLVRPQGKGVVAVDALVAVARENKE